EHQDWEPPRWPGHVPITETDTDTRPEQDLPAHPEPELPPDPLPDWHSFTAAHPWPGTADTDDPGWPAPLNNPVTEGAVFQGA
ncbi:hypothetical protein OOZ51_21125, partial [Arthrobacter sp. MI7-26]|nr:hypothetical protein [Arthrobacter sp. MI7-26]